MKLTSKTLFILAFFIGTSFAQNELKIGAKALLGYNLLWGENSRSASGMEFGAGATLNYEITPLLKLHPELLIAYRSVSFSYTLSSPASESSFTQDLSFLYLELPILVQIEPIPSWFFEAGASLAFNFSASYETTTKTTHNLELHNDGKLEDASVFDVALVLGAGKSFAIGNGLDLHFRFALGFLNTYKDYFDAKSDLGYHDEKRDSKWMRFQIGATYWIL